MWCAPSREGNGIERCRIIDILISRPCCDGNAVHSLNCMDYRVIFQFKLLEAAVNRFGGERERLIMTRGWVLNVGCYLGWDLQRARSVPTWIISKVESTESTSFPVNSRCVRLNFIVAPLPLSYSIKELMPGREKKKSGCSDSLRPRVEDVH